MSTYFIGDIHGCYKNLNTILDYVSFDPKIDVVHLTGDLVSRGPNSLEVLRLIHKFGKSAKTVLGNHDLYLLKTYCGINNKNFKNCFNSILKAPDADELMNWLRYQPILHIDENRKILMSHAGISPNWNADQAKKYAQEIESILTSDKYSILFMKKNNQNQLNINDKNIQKIKQIQKNIDIFTRMRYVYANGRLAMQYKNTPEYTPKNIYPWFELTKLITVTYSIVFGHWAAIKNITTPPGIYGLDSGCCWGGELTLLRWEDKRIVRIPCSPPN